MEDLILQGHSDRTVVIDRVSQSPLPKILKFIRSVSMRVFEDVEARWLLASYVSAAKATIPKRMVSKTSAH